MGARTRIRSKTASPLDRVRLTPSERAAAEIYLRQGELFADFIVGAIAAVRSAVHGISRGLRGETKYIN
jgi:hypothetical protein